MVGSRVSLSIWAAFFLFQSTVHSPAVLAVDQQCIKALRLLNDGDLSGNDKKAMGQLLADVLNPRRGFFGQTKPVPELSPEAYEVLASLKDKLEREALGQATNLPFRMSSLFPDLEVRLHKITGVRATISAEIYELKQRLQEVTAQLTGERPIANAPAYNYTRMADLTVSGPETDALRQSHSLQKRVEKLERQSSALLLNRLEIYQEIWNRFLKETAFRRAFQKQSRERETALERKYLEGENKKIAELTAARTRIAILDDLRPKYEKILASLESKNAEAAAGIRKIAVDKGVKNNRAALHWILVRLREEAPAKTDERIIQDALIYFSLNGTTEDSQTWAGKPLEAYPVNPKIVAEYAAVTDELRYRMDAVADRLAIDYTPQLIRQYRPSREYRPHLRSLIRGLYETVRSFGYSRNEAIAKVSEYLTTRYEAKERAELSEMIDKLSRESSFKFLRRQAIRAALVTTLGAGLVWSGPHVSEFAYVNDLYSGALPEEFAREKIDALLKGPEDWAWQTYGEDSTEAINNAFDYLARQINTSRPIDSKVHIEKPMP